MQMIYKILVDGQERITKKQIPTLSREADNKAREEIIKHYLDTEDAREVQIIEVEYYGAAEPPVRWWRSHLSGLSEPPRLTTGYIAFSGSNP